MDSVAIPGATLALLLQSGERACDGLLFGDLCCTVTSQAMDTAETLLLEQCTAHVASSCACSSTHAFYTNTGAVVGDRLQALLASCGAAATPTAPGQQNKQLLGWFAFRPELPAVPSMLNAAVCQHLHAWMAQQQQQQQPPSQQQPLLFCLITRHADHNGATVSLQARFFSFNAAGHAHASAAAAAATTHNSSRAGGAAGVTQLLQHPSFKPLEVHILNLGPQQALQGRQPAAGGSGDATHASAVLHAAGEQRLSALAAALEPPPSSRTGPLGAKQQQQLIAAGDAAGGQMRVVEGLYSSLLEELAVAAAAASEQRGQLAALEAENAALRHQLRARQQPAAGGGLV